MRFGQFVTLSIFCRLVAAAFVVLFSGCYLDSKWEDVPGAVVTPIADREENQEAWAANVETAVDEWGDGLEAIGCPRPFTVGDDGHEVRLFYTEGRQHGIQWGSGVGSPGEVIEVHQTNPAYKRIVRHELGHAIGLDHVDATDGFTIMEHAGYYDTITQRDFEQAACILGCGPCS